MSYRYYFFDDQTVGAEDMNKLVKMFVSNGVADNFENGTPYNISKLGEIVSENASDGTVPETNKTLAVSCDGTYAYIEPGTAFFRDGTVIEIETKEQLEIPEAATEFYVYLVSDALLNKAYPALSESIPEDKNTVPLARVSETGEITDLRQYARGKVPSFYASAGGVRIEKTFTLSDEDGYIDSEKRLTLIDSGNSYRYIMLLCRKEDDDTELGYIWATTLLYDTETDMCYNFSRTYNGDYTDDYTNVSKGTSFRILDFYHGLSHYIVHGNLYFTDGKAELTMNRGDKKSISESSSKRTTYPLKITVIAC